MESPDIKAGDIVEFVNPGSTYSSYESFYERYKYHVKYRWAGHAPQIFSEKGMTGTVRVIAQHFESAEKMVTIVDVHDSERCFVIGISGLKTIGKDKDYDPRDANPFLSIIELSEKVVRG